MIALPYIVLVLIMFIRHYISNCTEIYKYSEKIFIYFVLGFFFCFRGFIFTDVFNYYAFFAYCPNLIKIFETHFLKTSFWEPGFACYCGLIKLFTDNWLIFQIIDSTIDLILLYKALEYFDSNRAENIIVFLAMSGLIAFIDNIRNIKAILLFFVSLRYIYEKKVFKYYIFCLIAISFHKSAFFYFFVYPLMNIKLTKKKFLLYGVISICFAICSRTVIQIVLNIVIQFLPKLFRVVLSSYILEANSMSLGRIVTLGTIEKVLVFSLVYKNFDKLKIEEKGYLLVKIFLLYFLSYFIFFGFGEASNRVSMLFVVSYWCIIPKIVKLQDKRYRSLYIVCVLAYCVLKMCLYKQPVQQYENFLFGASSIDARRLILKQYY